MNANVELTMMVVQTIVSALGFVAVVISLLYVAKQTREVSKQSKSLEESIRIQVYQGVSSDMQEIDRVFIEHPELRPYFYAGADPPKDSSVELDSIMSIAEMKLDFYDSVLVQMDHFPEKFVTNWREGIRDAFRHSPILRSMLNSHPAWYTPELSRLATRLSPQSDIIRSEEH